MGERGLGPYRPRAARPPGRADRSRRRGVPAHGGRRQRRIAGGHAVAGVRRLGADGLVPRPGDGSVVGRRPVRRRRAAGSPARHVPPPARGHPGVRAPPRSPRRGRVPRTATRRVPLVRHDRASAPVRVRPRARVRGPRHRARRGRSIRSPSRSTSGTRRPTTGSPSPRSTSIAPGTTAPATSPSSASSGSPGARRRPGSRPPCTSSSTPGRTRPGMSRPTRGSRCPTRTSCASGRRHGTSPSASATFTDAGPGDCRLGDDG